MKLKASMVYIGSEFQTSMGFIRRLHKTNKQTGNKMQESIFKYLRL